MKTTTRARAQISTVTHGMKRLQLNTRPSAGGHQGTHRERTALRWRVDQASTDENFTHVLKFSVENRGGNLKVAVWAETQSSFRI